MFPALVSLVPPGAGAGAGAGVGVGVLGLVAGVFVVAPTGGFRLLCSHTYTNMFLLYN